MPDDAAANAVLAAQAAAVMSKAALLYRRSVAGGEKMIDVRSFLLRAEVAGPSAHRALVDVGINERLAIDVDCAVTVQGGVKAAEIAAVMIDADAKALPLRALRVELFGRDSGGKFSPLELARARAAACVEPAMDHAAAPSKNDGTRGGALASVRRGGYLVANDDRRDP
jgi:hypothetical protein